MILFIDTTSDIIKISLKKEGRVFLEKKVKAERRQAEKLLASIDGILKKARAGLKDIKKIEVVNKGGSFTSLRIGVATANALGFALGIPVKSVIGLGVRAKKGFNVVGPIYDKEPNITLKKGIENN